MAKIMQKSGKKICTMSKIMQKSGKKIWTWLPIPLFPLPLYTGNLERRRSQIALRATRERRDQHAHW